MKDNVQDVFRKLWEGDKPKKKPPTKTKVKPPPKRNPQRGF
jgi:hypothetical protein